jgi:monoamine oxidase
MFDAAILGGGISGLYLAYKLLKTQQATLGKPRRILLIEKSKSIGGRIHTYKDAHMSVEAGAGRIHKGHHRFLGLIRELGLGHLLVQIDNDSRFVRQEDNTIGDSPYRPIASLLIREAKKRPKHELIQKTLFEFAVEVCGKESAELALDSFGYTTEFLVMNAYDAIELMKIIALHSEYYVLSGGLVQVVEALVERIKTLGGIIVQGQSVDAIRYRRAAPSGGPYTIFCSGGVEYEARRCVATFTAKAVAAIRFLGDTEFKEWAKDWKRIIKASIFGGSLCRIYSKFDESWFAKLGKLTIDNDLRMIIPIDAKTGVVMISYSDGPVANKWAKLEESAGIREVNRRLKSLVEDGLGIKLVGGPKHTKLFHWSDAVGYWRVGADSAKVERMAVDGFCGMHFAGENYSRANQQWVEGSLDTSDLVLDRILPVI